MAGLNSRIKSSAVSVGTTAVALPTTALAGRKSMVIKNNGAAIVYLGHSGVSISNGYPLAAGAEVGLDIEQNLIIYGRIASGTVDVRLLEGV